MLRICPLFERPNANPARQYNLEYRAADATSNPWIVLGVLIRAGLEGIRAGLDAPHIVEKNYASLTPEQLTEYNVTPLPTSLDNALELLDQDETVKGWFSERLYSTFVTVKRNEIDYVAALPEDGHYAAYSSAY